MKTRQINVRFRLRCNIFCTISPLAIVFLSCLPILIACFAAFSAPKVSSPQNYENTPTPTREFDLNRLECRTTCKIEVVESIPENITFGRGPLPRTTFDAWKTLIQSAQKGIDIAAYKSSLRGKHVLGDSTPSSQLGEEIFDYLVEAGNQRNVPIRMVENFPPKDTGDNEDGMSLARRGAVERRPLHFSKVFGAGTMHSKFLVVDQKHLYLGSANLDWRSLNQKMELGVLIMDCPCLGRDLKDVFTSYWALTAKQTVTEAGADPRIPAGGAATEYNQYNPLSIIHEGVETDVYIATSPLELNGEGRTWDLHAILSTIRGAEKFLYIHVMDYIPMMVYSDPQTYWPLIDSEIRAAVVDRGVEVKLLAAALHHVPQTLRFLKSLQSLNGISAKGSINVKIFKVPAVTEEQKLSVIARDRRTHNKFVVSEESVIIGTSNWSGDYFMGNTGVALVVTQNKTEDRPFVEEMRQIFFRDWDSDYAHTLTTYMSLCLHRKDSTLCEVEKAKRY